MISLDWSAFKSIKDTKELRIQFIELEERYILTSSDSSFIIDTVIKKTEPRNTDQIDFEDNYKALSETNKPLVQHASVSTSPKKTIVETLTSQITYEGEAEDLSALSNESKWRIRRIVTQGKVSTIEYALDGKYDRIWDDRESLFSPLVLSNPASLLFDGVDEHVDIGDNYGFGPAQAFSWSFWFKADNFSQQRTFISKTTQDANVYGYSLQHNALGQLFAQFRASGSLRSHTFVTPLLPGTWYHVCLTYSGGSNMNGLTAYINASAEPKPASSSLADWSHNFPLYLGSRGGAFFYSGNMNNVSVWNKELSSQEVSDIYNSGSPADLKSHSAVANLQSWWYLNNNDNFPTEVDQVGTINGTLLNMEPEDYIEGDVP